MPLVTREQFDQVRALMAGDRPPGLIVIFGDRFLCQQLAADIVDLLLPDADQQRTNCIVIDGDAEDPAQTLAQLRTYSLFGGRRVFRVSESRLLLSRESAEALWNRAEKAWQAQKESLATRLVHRLLTFAGDGVPPADLATWDAQRWQKVFGFARPDNAGWLASIAPPDRSPTAAGIEERYCEAFEQGRIPADHFLILTAEAADRRKRLVKLAEKIGVVIDARVDTGRSRAATKQQETVLAECIDRVLAEYGKRMQPATRAKLIERTGFHPDAVVMETEKLALYAADEPTITDRHLREIGCRTREDAIYELNETVSDGRVEEALTLVRRLLEGGTHPLAIIAALRNHLHRLLVVRAVQTAGPTGFHPRISYQDFQKRYLPEVKEEHGQLLTDLPRHTYAVYMLFVKATRFSLGRLQKGLDALLEAEHIIKRSGLPAATVLEAFLLAFLQAEDEENTRRPQRKSA